MNSSVPIIRRHAQNKQLRNTSDDLLQYLYLNRGISADDSKLELARLCSPAALSNIDNAVQLLQAAITNEHVILIIGDYDCDGATASALAVRGLKLLGAKRVAYRVPNRVEHGYGLSSTLVQELNGFEPGLIITVDNGIACHAGVQAAIKLGWQVLITDHHLPGKTLPAADAIVNPNLHGDAFPSKALAGVGVMFYLLLALRSQLRAQGSAYGQADLNSLLDLLAIGTVADLVPLDYNNRVLVAAGLKRIRQGLACAGINALIQVAGRSAALCTASDIGFAIGPRINAAGRMEDMSIGIECLLSDDPQHAMDLATQLNDINASRREVQQLMIDQAEFSLSTMDISAGNERPAWCFYRSDWHAGIVGLVASRLKERLHRPVIAFAPAQEGDLELKGSARSIPGLHIRDVLTEIDSQFPGLIQRFGGHAMAAGLSLQLADLGAFEQALSDVVATKLSPELLQNQVWSDGPLFAHEYDRSVAEQLKLAGPWGQGCAEPVFDDDFLVVSATLLGGKHLKLLVQHPQFGIQLSGIQFNAQDQATPGEIVKIAFELGLDDFRGRNSIQLLIRQLQAVSA